jgi:hypothetical protein
MAETANLAARLSDLLLGYQRTQLIHAAVALGLTDELALEARTVGDLSGLLALDPDACRRLVDALASLDLVQLGADGRVGLTPLGSLLSADSPNSLRGAALLHGHDFYPLWADLPESLRTGLPAFERVYGLPNWEYRKQHPEANARFDAFMARAARDRAACLLAAARLPERGVVVDVGGGNGTLLAVVLSERPQLTGILLDQPHVVAGAADVLAAAGVSDRCQVVPGDFFTAVPGEGDVYVLSGVLLDWSDDHAARILDRCRRAMPESAELLLVDLVLPDDHGSPAAHLLDVHMLLTNTGGRIRRQAEWERLLAESGFRLEAVLQGGTFDVLHAHPASSPVHPADPQD